MGMGQAAGTAAAMVAKRKLESVRAVDIEALQSSLLKQGCILDSAAAIRAGSRV
jgi:hypothetical protein